MQTSTKQLSKDGSSKRITFSIQKLVWITLVVGVWGAVFRLSPNLAIACLCPTIVLATAYLFASWRVIFWLPIAFMLSSHAPVLFGYSHTHLLGAAVYFGLVLFAIISNTISKLLPRQHEYSTIRNLNAEVLMCSVLSSFLIGLYSSFIIVSFQMLTDGFQLANLLPSTFFIVCFSGTFAIMGLLLAFPLICVCVFIFGNDFTKPESEFYESPDP